MLRAYTWHENFKPRFMISFCNVLKLFFFESRGGQPQGHGPAQESNDSYGPCPLKNADMNVQVLFHTILRDSLVP